VRLFVQWVGVKRVVVEEAPAVDLIPAVRARADRRAGFALFV